MLLFAAGAIVLIYLGIAIALMLWAIVWAGNRGFGIGGRIGAAVVVLGVAYAIPFGDHTIGLIKFKGLCDGQAGMNIYETIYEVDGVMWRIASGKQVEPYTTHGYGFYEQKGFKGELYRYVQQQNGSIKEEIGTKPQAKYESRLDSPIPIGANYTKSVFSIVELETARTLASYASVHFKGGWLMRELSGIGVSGPSCPDDRGSFDPISFTRTVLKPNTPRGDK